MIVNDVIQNATIRYNDTSYTRLSQSQYLAFLDAAILKLLMVRPDAHITTTTVGLSAGTRQEIPSDGFTLIDIYRNMNGSSPNWTDGAPVYQVSQKDLDYFSDWHTGATTATDIIEYTIDLNNPRIFWVYPSVATADSVYVEMAYSSKIDSYAELTDDFADILDMDIPIDDRYRSALVDYLLFLCFSTDSSSTNDITLAQQYLQSFYQELGIEYQATTQFSPKLGS